MNIKVRDATLNYHEVFAPKCIGLNLILRQDKFVPLMLQP